MNIRRHYEEESAKPRYINSLYPGRCRRCGKAIRAGDKILWVSSFKTTYCEACGPEVKEALEDVKW